MKSSKVRIRNTIQKARRNFFQNYITIFMMPVLFVGVSWQASAQTREIKLSKPEKSKVIKTLLEADDLVETEFPGKGKGIFISFFGVPNDVIALFPKQIKKKKVIFLTEKDTEKIAGEKWAYHKIGPFTFYSNRLVASIGFYARCYNNVQPFEFFRAGGRLKARKLGSETGECLTWENDSKAEAEEIYPIVKTKKPNE